MAKILYITTTYLIKNSSAAIRNNSVVKGLVELGHDVDVFTLEWAEDLSSPFFIAEKNGNIHTSKLSNLTRIANVKKKLSHNGKFTIKLKQISGLKDKNVENKIKYIAIFWDLIVFICFSSSEVKLFSIFIPHFII